MKEKENNQPTGVYLPPAWCGAICRNAMNEVCVEHCAVKRDCSFFEEKQNLKLEDMRPFPKKEELKTPQEKFTAVTVYVSKMVDRLQGNEAEHQTLAIRRRDVYASNSEGSASVKIAEVLANGILPAMESQSTCDSTTKKEDE